MKIADGNHLITGFSITMGALPAVIFLIFAELIVDYCGHSNILIFCFVNYICHHLGKLFFLLLTDKKITRLYCITKLPEPLTDQLHPKREKEISPPPLTYRYLRKFMHHRGLAPTSQISSNYIPLPHSSYDRGQSLTA